jgi:oligopeptide transport system ATP-binding protein
MNNQNRSSASLLEVRGLTTSFASPDGPIRVVEDVSLYVNEGETLGLVGESGCGKSVTALSIMGLVPSPPGQIEHGEVLFEGHDLLQYSETEMQSIRGRRIAMIFQEPMTSLNPVLTVGWQLVEPLRLHLNMPKRAAYMRAYELLEMVGIPDPGTRLEDYPHRMSGGQRQRVMIAMALSCNPSLIIGDEATTALDVTIQAQVLELMADLTAEFNTALLIITHNMGIVARYADRVNVMYSGKIREAGTADDIYGNPKHPYTIGLLNSIPSFERSTDERLQAIPGEIPDPANRPSGCAFRPRCPWGVEGCAEEEPPLTTVQGDHLSACWEQARVSMSGSVTP